MKCESCGMPMLQPEDYGASRYCKYCAPDGKLRSRAEVREGWINVVIKMENITREEAEKKVDEVMPKMPAWKR